MRVARVSGAGNLLLAKRDGQPFRENLLGEPSVKEPVDQGARKPRPTFLGDMNAIACGVEAWVEEDTGYSRRVTATTVEIARALSVPEGEIKRWESARSIRDTEKGRVVKSLLARLQGGLLWR